MVRNFNMPNTERKTAALTTDIEAITKLVTVLPIEFVTMTGTVILALPDVVVLWGIPEG